MSMNLNFDLVAIAVLIILLVYYQRKRSAILTSYKLFYGMLMGLVMLGVLDVICYIFAMHPEVVSPIIIIGVNLLALGELVSLPVVFTVYVLCLAIIDSTPPKYWLYSIYLPGSLSVLVSIFFMIRDYIIGADPGNFRFNPIMQVILIAAVLYQMVLCVIIGIRYGGMLGLKSNVHAMSTGAILSAACVIQIMKPDYYVAVFVGTMVMTDLLMAVQKPEQIFEKTDAMKKKFIFEAARMDFERKKPFAVIFIRILDYNVLVESLGREDTESFLKHVSSFLFELKYHAQVFQIDSDLIAVRFSTSGKMESDSIFEEVSSRFKEPWRSGFMETMLSVGYLRINCPGDVDDMSGFEYLMKKMNMVQMQPGEECSVSRLLGDDKEKQILSAVRRALDEDTFQVYYQPIYSTHDKKVIAAEALIRLFDPEYGFIPPEPMIALAEREGYILRIGEIVFREVCRFYSENKLDKLGIEYIEVNLSAVQVMKSKLAEQFIGIMKDYKLGPERINFEITESSAMINDAEVKGNIESFEKQGVSLSLDDYGTGYSNISYLYNLPFMIIKVDKSILWSSEKNEKADIILKNTFRMANRLNMKVVMEGVETEAQIKKLLALNCDYFQGYYFSKPVEGKKFIDYVKEFSLPEVCK